jgi:hypothetical protein
MNSGFDLLISVTIKIVFFWDTKVLNFQIYTDVSDEPTTYTNNVANYGCSSHLCDIGIFQIMISSNCNAILPSII